MPDDLAGRARAIQAAASRFAAQAGGSHGAAVRLSITDDANGNTRGLDRLFAGLGATIDAFPAVLADAVPTIRDAHRAVFASEGSSGRGRWSSLAPRTQEERRRLGYGPTGPILVRTGALRAHVLAAPAQITRTGAGVELRIAPDPSVGGVRKYRALARGMAARSLPARPMVALGPAAANRVTSTISRALRARAAANGLS